MLSETLNNISTILNISPDIIPNIITFIIVTTIIIISLSSGLGWQGLLIIYGIVMLILQLVLGIESVFNIFTLFEKLIDEIGSLIF